MLQQMLETKYSFFEAYTLLEVAGLRLIYVLPNNIAVLRDEIYDHAFIFFRSTEKATVDWRKIKNEDRKNIHVKSVRRPSSYINGCVLVMPPHISIEREEVLIRIDDDHVARLFSYSVQGKRFVPEHLKDKILSEKEELSLQKTASEQPLIDINTLPCPDRENSTTQIPLL